MTELKADTLWTRYQDAWADIAGPERERLIRSAVDASVVFADPDTEGRGTANLIKHIEAFQAHYPGAFFRHNRLVVHHGQLLAEWTMFNKDGSAFLTAHSYARVNEAGLLTHLAGFWTL